MAAISHCQWEQKGAQLFRRAVWPRLLKFLLAFQMALVVKNLPANAGDIRDTIVIPRSNDPLEEATATHSSILSWRIPIDRGAWRATVHGVTKSQTRLRRT